jgi:hypothetical protein
MVRDFPGLLFLRLRDRSLEVGEGELAVAVFIVDEEVAVGIT